jgi:hypothetical protein
VPQRNQLRSDGAGSGLVGGGGCALVVGKIFTLGAQRQENHVVEAVIEGGYAW